ncbi:hypothetical protein LRY65_02785 [Candidatus Woesebacteria bacterium]|nr:hypothetical protein [Candidatus Woesebacteria bacterium]MCD8527117.1 hypothetical protein [Candidatus Woesebacteria bacterium]MCD8546846.1 hypothetical protein [Candidatus Woesebacteria bacterium]
MTFSRDRRFTPVSGTRIPIYDGINGNSQDGYLPSSAWLRIVETKLKPDKKIAGYWMLISCPSHVNHEKHVFIKADDFDKLLC